MCRLATLLHSQLIHSNKSNELQDMEEIQYFLMYIIFLSGPISLSVTFTYSLRYYQNASPIPCKIADQ
jgi:hypothetical protein